MHFAAEAVSHHLPYHGVSVLFGMFLHSIADIAYAIAGFRLCDPFIKSLFGDSEQTLRFRSDLPYSKRVGRITTKPLHKCATIHRKNIAFFQNGFRRGNPVYNLFVDRHAKRVRKTVVSEKTGNSPVAADKIFGYFIQLEGRHARLDVLSQFSQRSAHE